jgi:hypothetical protein
VPELIMMTLIVVWIFSRWFRGEPRPPKDRRRA